MNTLNFFIRCHEIRTNDINIPYEKIFTELIPTIDTIFYLFDVTNEIDLNSILAYFNQLREKYKFSKQIILVPNKIDCSNRRKVAKIDIQTFSKENLIKCVEISIKDNVNLTKLFNSIEFKKIAENDKEKECECIITEVPQNSDLSIDITYKIIILGNGSVGKTSFFKRYLNNFFFIDGLESIGINQYIKY